MLHLSGFREQVADLQEAMQDHGLVTNLDAHETDSEWSDNEPSVMSSSRSSSVLSQADGWDAGPSAQPLEGQVSGPEASSSATPLPSVQARLRELFTAIDADQNGTLSREELALKLRADTELQQLLADAGKSSHYVFEQLDRDGDGSITVDEFVRLCVPEDSEEEAEAGEQQQQEEEEEEEAEEEETLLEANVDVTVVEEGILGSGRTDVAPSSVAGTEDFESEAAGDTADDIPVFRLGDVGNTGPIPHYSPACKASPSVVARPLSAIKSPGCASVQASPASASKNTPGSLRRSRRSSAGARSTPGSVAGATPGTAPRPAAPANTPATGAGVKIGNALLAGLEGYAANLARTPGGHAELGAVARILVDEADDEEEEMEKEMAVNVTVEEEIEGAAEFVLAAEAAAAAEAAEAAAEAGAAAAAAAEGDDFDFDEAFAADAALVAEGVADVEAAAEIEAALELDKTKTPEKVAAWLEANLAEVEVEMAAKSPGSVAGSVAAKSPGSVAAKSPAAAAKSPAMNVLPRDSPALEIIRARGGVAGGRAYGGLSARVAQLHRALRVTRAALLRERQRSKSFKKLYLKAAAQATAANEAAAIAAAEVAKATEAAVEAANAPKEVIKLELNVVERKATPAKKIETTPAKKASPAAASPAPSTRSPAPSTPTDAPIVSEDDEDEKCKVCGCNDERVAVLCDDCDAVYHLGCLKPKLRKVPVGDWFCKPCADARKPKRGRAKKEEAKDAEEAKEEAKDAPAAKRTRRAAAAPKPAAEPAVATRRSTRNRN